MKRLFQKKIGTNEKGFTLAELLIVVAIVAVLVAISIPVFTSKLEKAREATDVANMRAAKAEAVAEYLSDDTKTGTFYYDAGNGTLVSTTTKPTGYGKGTTTSGGITYTGYSDTTAYTDLVIKVVIATDGTVTMSWE